MRERQGRKLRENNIAILKPEKYISLVPKQRITAANNIVDIFETNHLHRFQAELKIQLPLVFSKKNSLYPKFVDTEWENPER